MRMRPVLIYIHRGLHWTQQYWEESVVPVSRPKDEESLLRTRVQPLHLNQKLRFHSSRALVLILISRRQKGVNLESITFIKIIFCYFSTMNPIYELYIRKAEYRIYIGLFYNPPPAFIFRVKSCLWFSTSQSKGVNLQFVGILKAAFL